MRGFWLEPRSLPKTSAYLTRFQTWQSACQFLSPVRFKLFSLSLALECIPSSAINHTQHTLLSKATLNWTCSASQLSLTCVAKTNPVQCATHWQPDTWVCVCVCEGNRSQGSDQVKKSIFSKLIYTAKERAYIIPGRKLQRSSLRLRLHWSNKQAKSQGVKNQEY